MKKINPIFVGLTIVTFALTLSACDTTSSSGDIGNWLIPASEVRDGGPGRDGIPSIDNPQFASVDEIDFIVDDRLVIGVKSGDEVKAYPHQILDWHEIVNDEIGNTPFALTYCPLTGTGIGWHREINGAVTEFGVSGLLFRNNLIPFDRNSDSEWSQMQLRGVRGENSGKIIETVDVIETNWSTWKEMYPNSQVLTTETGFSRNYQGFAYGRSYLTSNGTLFPVKNEDNRLQDKERVHGIIADTPANEEAAVKVYVINDMEGGINVIEDTFQGIEHVIVGSGELNLAASFERNLDGTMLNFEPVNDALPVVMEDQEGNRWDLFGNAVSGPREGQQLTPTNSYTGYWFAWADFFPGLEIYQDDSQ